MNSVQTDMYKYESHLHYYSSFTQMVYDIFTNSVFKNCRHSLFTHKKNHNYYTIVIALLEPEPEV